MNKDEIMYCIVKDKILSNKEYLQCKHCQRGMAINCKTDALIGTEYNNLLNNYIRRQKLKRIV